MYKLKRQINPGLNESEEELLFYEEQDVQFSEISGGLQELFPNDEDSNYLVDLSLMELEDRTDNNDELERYFLQPGFSDTINLDEDSLKQAVITLLGNYSEDKLSDHGFAGGANDYVLIDEEGGINVIRNLRNQSGELNAVIRFEDATFLEIRDSLLYNTTAAGDDFFECEPFIFLPPEELANIPIQHRAGLQSTSAPIILKEESIPLNLAEVSWEE